MLTSCLYCSPTSFYLHRQFNCFICVAYSAGQILCTDALNVVDFQFTCDGHNPIFVPDSLLGRSRIEQVAPGDGGLWETISITDGCQVTFRYVVMDRCNKTFQHTNETSHHHREHLLIISRRSLTLRIRAKLTWFTLSPMARNARRVPWVRSLPWLNTTSPILKSYTPKISLNLKSKY